MLMRYTKSVGAMAVPGDDPNWDFRQGDLGEQPAVIWVLASFWAFKRQGIKPSTSISSGK